MEQKHYLKHLVEHPNWANRRILNAIGQHPAGDGVELFAHILTTENVYYRRITGQEPWPLEFWPKLSLEEMADLLQENYDNYNNFISSHSEKQLSGTVKYKNGKGTTYQNDISEMIIHVALHGQNHQGQITRLIHAAGGEPPVTDYIWYTRLR
jgi:uncharacterized damage-inducible protein DinB